MNAVCQTLPSLRPRKAVALLGVVLVAATPAASASASPVQILVPAYFYPSQGGSDWDKLAAAAKTGAPITAILNPDSGPSFAANPDYIAAIARFRAAGGKVLGYIPTGYTGSQISDGASCASTKLGGYTTGDIIGCAARYQSYYKIDGIFVDEFGAPAAGAPLADINAFYTTIYDGLKTINSAWSVIGNPGTNVPEALLRNGTQGGADTLVTYEDSLANYGQFRPDPYAANYDRSRFGNIVYGVPFARLGYLLGRAARDNIGYVYFTDEPLATAYDALPTYWDQEVVAVNRLNASPVSEPSPLAVFAVAGAAALARLRKQRARNTK